MLREANTTTYQGRSDIHHHPHGVLALARGLGLS
jgi:hypothetical protein